MKRLFGLGLIITAALVLFGCDHQEKNYEYFMLNPLSIKPVYDQCEGMDPGQAMNNKECVAVVKAQQDVSVLIEQATQNGQEYGANLINAQVKLVEDQQIVKSASNALQSLQKSNANAADIQAAKERLAKAQVEVKKQTFLIKSHQAVLRLMGP